MTHSVPPNSVHVCVLASPYLPTGPKALYALLATVEGPIPRSAMAEAMGVSTRTVSYWLADLVAAKVIERVTNYHEDGGRVADTYRLVHSPSCPHAGKGESEEATATG